MYNCEFEEIEADNYEEIEEKSYFQKKLNLKIY